MPWHTVLTVVWCYRPHNAVEVVRSFEGITWTHLSAVGDSGRFVEWTHNQGFGSCLLMFN